MDFVAKRDETFQNQTDGDRNLILNTLHLFVIGNICHWHSKHIVDVVD